MFGRVKPYIPDLRVREYGLYRAVYCGLCRELGLSCGGGARFTLSYDFVFLVLAALASSGEEPALRQIRCPAHPLKKRPALAECEALTHAAVSAAILTRGKLRDDVADERGWKRFAAKLCLPSANRALKRAIRRNSTSGGGGYDTLTEKTDAALEKLSDAERSGESPDVLADIFGGLLGDIFAAAVTTTEAGAEAGIVTDEGGDTRRRVLYETGFRCGRWLYFTDAADDLAEDKRLGRFNCFAAYYGGDAASHAKDIRNGCLCELARLKAAAELLGGTDDVAALISNITELGMTSASELISAKNGADI